MFEYGPTIMNSPSMKSIATPPSSGTSSPAPFGEERSLPGSPRSDKLLGVCKNCSHSYRLSRRNTEEFCSKDCQTNFLFFSHCTPTKASSKETRLAVYEFQQQLVAEENTTTCLTDRTELIVEVIETLPPKEDEKGDSNSAKKKHRAKANRASNLIESLFWSPRPARPQLHTFF